MLYLVAIYGLIYFSGEYFSNRFFASHSITVIGLILFLLFVYFFVLDKSRFPYSLKTRDKNPALFIPFLLWPIAIIGFSLAVKSKVCLDFYFLLTAVCGVAEELAFRGFLFDLQLNKFGQKPIFSAAVNGILFGLLHLVNIPLASVGTVVLRAACSACIGFSLCGLVYRLKSVWPAALLHFIINGVGGIISFNEANIYWRFICIILSLFNIGFGFILMRERKK